jgi:uncharacterized membrane protein YcgQ (UPF0703/DUF1980 family)
MRDKTKISQKRLAEYEDKIIEFHRFVINAMKQEDDDFCVFEDED